MTAKPELLIPITLFEQWHGELADEFTVKVLALKDRGLVAVPTPPLVAVADNAPLVDTSVVADPDAVMTLADRVTPLAPLRIGAVLPLKSMEPTPVIEALPPARVSCVTFTVSAPPLVPVSVKPVPMVVLFRL